MQGHVAREIEPQAVEGLAELIEARAYAHAVHAAELGMSSGPQMLQVYAREAATLLLSEVERHCVPLDSCDLGPASASRGQSSSCGGAVDQQQLSLSDAIISGGLRSIQPAPSQQPVPYTQLTTPTQREGG